MFLLTELEDRTFSNKSHQLIDYLNLFIQYIHILLLSLGSQN